MAGKKVFFAEALCRALKEEMERDDRVVLLGQDIAEYGAPHRETRGLHARFGPRRVRNTPIAEGAMVGLAAGAAAAGLRPVVFITYMDFLTLGLEPLLNYAAKLRYASAGQLHAPLVIKTTAGARGQGMTHSACLEAWLMGIPGVKVVMPSSAADAYGLLKSAIRDDGPVVFVDHKRLFARPGVIPDEEALVPIGRAVRRAEGRDLTLVSHSEMCLRSQEAARLLEQEGHACAVIDLRSLWPLDLDEVLASARETGRVLFVEEGQPTCGVTAELMARLFERLPRARAARLGARRLPVSASPALERFVIPDAARIAAAARALLQPSA